MTDPAAVKLAQDFQSQLRAADEQAILHMAKRWGNIESQLEAAIDALADDIAKLQETGETVGIGKLYQIERYQSLLAQVGGEMAHYQQWAFTQIKEEALKNQRLAREHAQEMLMAAAGPSPSQQIRAMWDRLNVSPTEKVTALAQGGKPLNDILQNAYPLAVQGLTNKLLLGTTLGWHPRKTAREMIRNGGLDQGLNHILLVARDQQIRNYREASRDAYRASNVVYGYKRLAAKNERTCMACLALDGQIQPTSEVMPLHPQDRCSTIPLVVGRPVPEWESGLDWFRKQPEATQYKMLGKGRFNLWKERGFKLRQMVSIKQNNIWGPSAQETPLKVLKAGGGGQSGDQPTPEGLLSTHLGVVSQPIQAKQIDLKAAGTNTNKFIGEAVIKSSILTESAKAGAIAAVKKAGKGDQGILLADSDGQPIGAISWDEEDPHVLKVTAAGFSDPEGNLKALQQVAQAAQVQSKGIQAKVPDELLRRYDSWGWQLQERSGPGHFYMELPAKDVTGFIQDPEGLAKLKKLELGAQKAADLQDPNKIVNFITGQELGGLPYEAVDLLEGTDLSKWGPDYHLAADIETLRPVSEIFHQSTGMILFDPASGKFVIHKQKGGFAGYNMTIPKGTVEEGESYHDAAIREVWEETGFIPKIVGSVGDYKKTSSFNRFYIGIVDQGAPWGAGWESPSVSLVPPDQLIDMLGNKQDKQIAADFLEIYQKAQEAGGGDWLKGIAAVEAENRKKAEAQHQFNENSYFEWLDGGPELMEIDDLKAALSYARKYDPPVADGIKADLAELIKAEKEAKQALQAETQKHLDMFSDYLLNGPVVLQKVRIHDLRAAIAFGYETGAPSEVLSEVEAIYAERQELKLLQEPVLFPAGFEEMTKKELVEVLAVQTGVTKWKINQLTKAQIQALDGQTHEAVLEAGEAGAAKYYAAKTSKVEPRPEPRPAALFHMPPEIQQGTKGKIVSWLVTEAQVTKWKIAQLPKDDLLALSGQDLRTIQAAAEQGATQYYEAKKLKKAQPVETPATIADRLKKAQVEIFPELPGHMGYQEYKQLVSQFTGLSMDDMVYVTAGDISEQLAGQPRDVAIDFLQTMILEGKALQAHVVWNTAADDQEAIKKLAEFDADVLELASKGGPGAPGGLIFQADCAKALNLKKAADQAQAQDKADEAQAWNKFNDLLERDLTNEEIAAAMTMEELKLAKVGTSNLVNRAIAEEIIAVKTAQGAGAPPPPPPPEGKTPLESRAIALGSEVNDKWNNSKDLYLADFAKKLEIEELGALIAYYDHLGAHSDLTLTELGEILTEKNEAQAQAFLVYDELAAQPWTKPADIAKQMTLEELKLAKAKLSKAPYVQKKIDEVIAIKEEVLEDQAFFDELKAGDPFLADMTYEDYKAVEAKTAATPKETTAAEWLGIERGDEAEYLDLDAQESKDLWNAAFYQAGSLQEGVEKAATLMTTQQLQSALKVADSYDQKFIKAALAQKEDQEFVEELPTVEPATSPDVALEKVAKITANADYDVLSDISYQNALAKGLTVEEINAALKVADDYTKSQLEGALSHKLATEETTVKAEDIYEIYLDTVIDALNDKEAVAALAEKFNAAEIQALIDSDLSDISEKNVYLKPALEKLTTKEPEPARPAVEKVDTVGGWLPDVVKEGDDLLKAYIAHEVPTQNTYELFDDPGYGPEYFIKLKAFLEQPDAGEKSILDKAAVKAAIGQIDATFNDALEKGKITQAELDRLENKAKGLTEPNPDQIFKELNQKKGDAIQKALGLYKQGTDHQAGVRSMAKNMTLEELELAHAYLGVGAGSIHEYKIVDAIKLKKGATQPAEEPKEVLPGGMKAYHKFWDNYNDFDDDILSHDEILKAAANLMTVEELEAAYSYAFIHNLSKSDVKQGLDYIKPADVEEELDPFDAFNKWSQFWNTHGLDHHQIADEMSQAELEAAAAYAGSFSMDNLSFIKMSLAVKAQPAEPTGAGLAKMAADINTGAHYQVLKFAKDQISADPIGDLKKTFSPQALAEAIVTADHINNVVDKIYVEDIVNALGLHGHYVEGHIPDPEKIGKAQPAAKEAWEITLEKYQENQEYMKQHGGLGKPPHEISHEQMAELAKVKPELFDKEVIGFLEGVTGQTLKPFSGIPLPKGKTQKGLKYMKKGDLVAHISTHSAWTVAELNKYKIADLAAFMTPSGGPESPLKAPTSVFTGIQELDVTPDLFQAPTGTIDITGANEDLVEIYKAKASLVDDSLFKAGVNKALGNVTDGARTFIYTDEAGNFQGIIALGNEGNTLKIKGAAFMNLEVNARGIADALNAADELGLPLYGWVPNKLQSQYTAWGFSNADSNYYQLKKSDAPADLLAAGSSTFNKQTEKGPLPLPAGTSSVKEAGQLPKAQLVDHIYNFTGITKASLNKLPKEELPKLVGHTNVASLVAKAVARIEEVEAYQTAIDNYNAKGVDKLTTSKEAYLTLEAIEKLRLEVEPAQMSRIRVKAMELEKWERENKPYTPRFRPRPIPRLKPDPELPKYKDFPADIDKMKVVQKLGGTTGAELVEDPATGKKYVRKYGGGPYPDEHVQNELYVDEMYRAMGFNVPRGQLYTGEGGRPVKLAEFIEGGQDLGSALSSANPVQRAKLERQLQDAFALDALVGNWDVAGANMDNILVDKDGTLWRIDNGGSLDFRAQGQKKSESFGPKVWNGWVTDLWSMRDPSLGGAALHSGPIFQKMGWYEIMNQAQALADNSEDLLAKVPEAEREILHARIEHMRDMAETSRAMQLDQYADSYPDTLHKHATNMKQDGLLDRLPQKMGQQSSSGYDRVYVFDENGRKWDNLRGSGSVVNFVSEYMSSQGLDQGWVASYMGSQAGSSWGGRPLAVKYHEYLNRGKPQNQYWNGSWTKAKKEYDETVRQIGGEDKFNETMATWRAFVFESLRNMDFKYNHPDEGYIQLGRTEPYDAVTGRRADPGVWQEPIARGLMDSSSIYQTVRVGGNQLTLQKVPYHRITAFYWHAPRAGSSDSPLYGDGENEFVGDFTDLPFVYMGTVSGGENMDDYWRRAAKALGEPELDPGSTKI